MAKKFEAYKIAAQGVGAVGSFYGLSTARVGTIGGSCCTSDARVGAIGYFCGLPTVWVGVTRSVHRLSITRVGANSTVDSALFPTDLGMGL